jgi:DNA-directed RNA polymerase subunit RPC12/RpoP
MIVHCPRCKTDNDLRRGVTEYRCSGCRTDWRIVRCTRCNAAFHADPQTEAWTCKRCGLHNVVPPYQPAPQPAMGPRPDLRQAWRRVPTAGKIVLALAPVIVIAGVLSVVLRSGGGSAPSKAAAAAHRSYCHDLSVLQDLGRADAVQRFVNKMHRDVVLYEKARDSTAVAQVKKIHAAAAHLHAALVANKDVGPATTHLEQVVSAGPVC